MRVLSIHKSAPLIDPRRKAKAAAAKAAAAKAPAKGAGKAARNGSGRRPGADAAKSGP
jgi:hypothetical protein